MLVNLNDVLRPAQQRHYAVGLFNTTDTDMLQAAIEAAEEMRAPIIIGTAEVLLPYGELQLIAPSVIAAAKRARVPVVVHYDHGLTFDRCMEALRLGFSSVMYDASAKPYAQNIQETREIVRIAHAFGATVEGEIGHVGSADGSDPAGEDRYTTLQEATDYLRDTGVDALAIAIGTAHGAYKTAPKLSFDRLAQIRAAVDAPLVLHGGSGLSDDDFRRAVQGGIAKVNIFTDLCLAGMAAQKQAVAENRDYLSARNLKKDAIRKAVMKKMALFGCQNKA
ncbi:MAG: class II fructose-bisphosphate aldolase [Eubacteriales bacterium]|nr:class II fructose-bisphosphate aldolase [Eubacteriales bacterium]